jgi:hypothetical protein
MEMVDRLESQLNVLARHCQLAFQEQQLDYLPEIATKLRLLLVRSNKNRPLIFDLMKELGIAFDVVLDGPPQLRRRTGDTTSTPAPGDRLSLDAFFDLRAVTIRTTAGLIDLTKRELIRAWSEQLGGAHEDWAVDESLSNALKTQLPFVKVRPMVLELRNCANIALRYGREVVARARTVVP